MKQNITVKLAGRDFSLCVESEMEEMIRSAVDRLNLEIDSLQYDYHGQEMSDVLRVVLLSEEMKLLKLEKTGNIAHDDITRQLEELDAALGEYLLSR